MISRNPDVKVRDLAAGCGLTERAVQAIVTDLEGTGYLTRTRRGRRNHYQLVEGTFFRHPAEAQHEIGSFVDLFAELTAGPGQTMTPGPHSGDPDEQQR